MTERNQTTTDLLARFDNSARAVKQTPAVVEVNEMFRGFAEDLVARLEDTYSLYSALRSLLCARDEAVRAVRWSETKEDK